MINKYKTLSLVTSSLLIILIATFSPKIWAKNEYSTRIPPQTERDVFSLTSFGLIGSEDYLLNIVITDEKGKPADADLTWYWTCARIWFWKKCNESLGSQSTYSHPFRVSVMLRNKKLMTAKNNSSTKTITVKASFFPRR